MAKRQQDKVRSLRAISANPGIRASYRRVIRSMIRAMREDYSRKLSALYEQLEWRIAADSSGPWKSPLQRMTDALDSLAGKWSSRFATFSEKAAPRMVKDVLKRVVKSRLTSIKDAGVKPLLRDMDLAGRISDKRVQTLVEANVALIKSIPKECHQRVAKLITQAISSQMSHEKLVESISKDFGVTERRANLIARDQVLKATQSMAQATDKELGITEGIWIHVPGRKSSRPTHVKMDGKRFTLTTGLWDSAVNKWVKTGELINCCCKYRPVVPESWTGSKTYGQAVYE